MPAQDDYSLRGLAVRWLEDETFFSICCRQHLFLGNINTSSTLTWLFGSPHAATAHDFPFNLEALNRKARSSWGDPSSIILQHTILPFFFPFQSPFHVEEAITTLKSPTLGSIKYKLGLLSGRFGAEHPLKACSECMISDRAVNGVAYWHLTHQYPGVVLCPKHHLPLRMSTKNRQWSGRFQWFLPDEAVLSPQPSNSPPVDLVRTLDALTGAILQLATYGLNYSFDQNRVCQVYRKALASLCLGQFIAEGAAVSFARYSSQLQPHPPFTALPTIESSAAVLLNQLIRSPRGHCHPLKHLVVIVWLFGSLDHFIEAYDRTNNSRQPVDRFLPETDAMPPIAFIKNISPHENNIIRRPKKLKLPIRQSILESLAKGETKQIICSSFKITISTLNKLLRSEPKTQDQWKTQSEISKGETYRRAWTIAAKVAPNFGVKRLRAISPHVYAWLYRNDLLWLRKQIQHLPNNRLGNYSNVDWATRDAELTRSIKSAIEAGLIKGCIFTRETLYLQFPNLAKSLNQTEHYPRARELVSKITGKSKP